MEVCCGASQCTEAVQVIVIQCELLRHAIVTLTSEGNLLVWSTSTLRIYGTAESQTQPKNTLPTVQAQESGKQFQLQDDIHCALIGLCSRALQSDRAGSTAQ
jgi:hypothetical protein